MLEKYYFPNPDNTDLNMYRCGFEDCKPGHSWGPAIRDHYIIHYILAGKGFFRVNGKTYNLEKNDGFLICPDTVIQYEAHASEPWSYAWVGFHGLKAESYLAQAGLSINTPVFRYDKDNFLKDTFDQMLTTRNLKKSREIRLLGLLYIFLSQLVEAYGSAGSSGKPETGRDEYIRKAVEYILMNYSRKITVNEIARHVGLDRSYLYSIFKEALKTSPQEFLVNFRIGKACELMQVSSLSIGDISRSVGYEDPLQFSKVFKKAKGTSPRVYRNEL